MTDALALPRNDRRAGAPSERQTSLALPRNDRPRWRSLGTTDASPLPERLRRLLRQPAQDSHVTVVAAPERVDPEELVRGVEPLVVEAEGEAGQVGAEAAQAEV